MLQKYPLFVLRPLDILLQHFYLRILTIRDSVEEVEQRSNCIIFLTPNIASKGVATH